MANYSHLLLTPRNVIVAEHSPLNFPQVLFLEKKGRVARDSISWQDCGDCREGAQPRDEVARRSLDSPCGSR